MKNIKVFILACFTISLVSCGPKILGTWTVKKYEVVTPGQEATSLSNIGTMTFNKNNTGEKQLDYKAIGIEQTDNAPFTWSTTENYITIEGDNSELAKTWIYLENKGKSQKWKSTDGRNKVQTLELVKE